MPNSGLNTGRAPNFPTPPTKQFVMRNMPNDLIANGRNYYTEINFIDYRSAIYGADGVAGVQNLATNIAGVIGAGQLVSDLLSTINVAAIRLPLPVNINDTMTFNWDVVSATDTVLGMIPGVQQARAAAQGVGFLVGKALNPLLFAAFNRPNFRSFKFEWSLVPRNEQESETIRIITQTFKHSASPSGGILMDYPYVAIIRMFPNDLNGHVIFKPMVVRGINVNLTPLPTPSFFENSGSPTMVNLTVDMMEIKLWHREDIII